MSGQDASALQPFGLRRLALVASGATVLVLVFGARFLGSTFGAWDMRDLVTGMKSQLPFYSLPIGWLAVWAMRVHSPSSVLVGATPGRPRSAIVARQLGALSAAIVIGGLLGTAPAATKALTTQHWTGADVTSYVAVLVALASLLPVAACAAAALRPGVALVAAPLLVVAVTLVPAFVVNDQLLVNRPASIMSVAYVWSVALPARGLMLVWQVELLRILFFGLVWVVSAKVAAGLAEWRASRQGLALGNLAWLSLPLAVTVVVGYLQPILAIEDPDDQVRCTEHAGLRVCLFQIDDPHRNFVASAFQPLASLTHPSGEAPFTITQVARWTEHQRAASDIQIGRISGSPADWLDNELYSAALGQAGTFAECRSDDSAKLAFTVGYQLLERAARIAPDELIAAAYAERLGQEEMIDPAAQTRLSARSDDEFVTWFDQNRTTITECSLSHEDLP